MAKQLVNIGTEPNDRTGDPIRDAFDKVNDNFNELYSALGNEDGDLGFLLDEDGNIDITNNLNVTGGLTVTGNSTFNGETITIGDGSDGTTTINGATLQINPSLVRLSGNLEVAQYIKHLGDTTTNLEFGIGYVVLNSNGFSSIVANSASDSNKYVVVNEDGVDIDFRVESSSSQHALFVRGSDGNVGINSSNPSSTLTVGGTASVSDDFAVNTDTLFVDVSARKVGIGKADPVEKLHLNDANSTDTYLKITNSSTGEADADGLIIGMDGVNAEIINKENGTISIGTGNTSYLSIDEDGYIKTENQGTGNTFIGDLAGGLDFVGTMGRLNTAFGRTALQDLTIGNYNVAIGASALSDEVAGSYAVAVGYSALANQDNTIARDIFNTAIGSFSGHQVGAGATNTFLGARAGYNQFNGSDCIFIGYQSGGHQTGGSFSIDDSDTWINYANECIYIGNDSTSGSSDQSPTNEIVIGFQAAGNGDNTVTIGNSIVTDNHFYGNITTTGTISGSGVNVSGDFAVNTDTFFVDVSENAVGIGTDEPDRVLHIKDSVPAIRLEDSDVSGLYHEMLGTAAGQFQLKVDADNIQDDSEFALVIDGDAKMVVDSDGNVGIGETNPDEKLEVAGDVKIQGADGGNAGVLHFGNDSDQTKISGFDSGGSNVQDALLFYTNSTEKLRISSSGNVDVKTGNLNVSNGSLGVGISTDPAAKLEVKGGDTIASLSDWNTDSNTIFTLANPAVRLGVGYDASDIPLIQGFDTTNVARNISLQPYGGSVGINADSPLRKLHVVGSFAVNAGTDQYYGVYINGAGESSDPSILIGDWHNQSATLKWDSTGRGFVIDTQGNATSAGYFSITGNDEASTFFHIDTDGNVGIGTTSPDAKLDVNGTIAFNSLKDTTEDITITKFVDEADTIASNNNDTTIPTSAAVDAHIESKSTTDRNNSYKIMGIAMDYLSRVHDDGGTVEGMEDVMKNTEELILA